MGKLQLFMISLSNGQGIYQPGQIVEGNVTIDLSDSMNMRGIRVLFHGEGQVRFEEQESVGMGDNRRTEWRTYGSNETYVDMEILLAGRLKHGPGNDIQLTAGRHTFPFAFQLPPHLPSSYEGEHGYVRYSVVGTMDRPWKFDHLTKVLFTVISLLDLNLDPNAAIPAQGSNSKEFCCLCCASGPVSVTLFLDRRGYVPGEAIVIKAEVDNKSNRKMISTSVVLIMSTIYHAHMKDKTKTAPVASLVHGELLQGAVDHWSGEQLVVPAVPASYLAGCNIMDIRYTLELRVTPTGLGFDLTVPLEIVVGNIPLQHGVAQPLPTPQLQQIPTQAPHMLQQMPLQLQPMPQMQQMPSQHQPMPQMQQVPSQHQPMPQMQQMPSQYQPMPQMQQMPSQLPPMPQPQQLPSQHQAMPPVMPNSGNDQPSGEKAPVTSQPQVTPSPHLEMSRIVNDTHL